MLVSQPLGGEAVRLLRRWGGSAAPKLLGAGMEGAVYEIGRDRVAKVWFSGSVDGLRRMARFYDALAEKPFSFSVPRIVRVETVDDRVITVERRLTGDTLASALAAGTVRSADAYAMVVDVLAQLAASGELPVGREQTVLGEDTPLYAAGEDFPAALARLVARQVHRFGPVLARAVDDFEAKAAALAGRLREADSGRRCVIHGDLFPGNVLVDGAGRSSAVLDWGFLTTVGDPVFDAAVTASIFDMYEPGAPATERSLVERIADRMGYDPAGMLVYRAAYSLITANAYDPAGKDGHFAWCAAALGRPDITRALLG